LPDACSAKLQLGLTFLRFQLGLLKKQKLETRPPALAVGPGVLVL
jgi:hypothetical protein